MNTITINNNTFNADTISLAVTKLGQPQVNDKVTAIFQFGKDVWQVDGLVTQSGIYNLYLNGIRIPKPNCDFKLILT